MTAKPGAKRQAESEARKKAAGLLPVRVWAKKDHAPVIRAFAHDEPAILEYARKVKK
jgi:hypothetical protein